MKIALALGNVDWEADFVSVLSHPMLNTRVVRRCVDGIDLVATASVNEIDVAVITDATIRIDTNQVEALKDAKILVVAISNNPVRWQELGVQKVIEIDQTDLFSVARQLSQVGADSDASSLKEVSTANSFVCVASFGGGIGRSLTAKELGWWNANNGALTLIIEGDTYGASLHQELNLPALSKDLLQVSQMKVSPDSGEYELAQFTVVEPNLIVVPGLSHSSLWSSFRRGQLDRMWKAFAKSGDVVVDVGPVFNPIENVENELSSMTRDLVSQSALPNAQSIIFCAIANSVSVTRLIRGVLDNQESLRNLDVHVVLNRCRDAKSTKELTQLISRHTGIDQVTCVPEDAAALEKAELKCDFLGKIQAKNEISQQFFNLARTVFERESAPITQIQERRLQRATAA